MNIDFNKNKDGLVPAIIQDDLTSKVLMLGYLNKESLSLTLSTDVVHFYSRTKQRIWKKGEDAKWRMAVDMWSSLRNNN